MGVQKLNFHIYPDERTPTQVDKISYLGTSITAEGKHAHIHKVDTKPRRGKVNTAVCRPYVQTVRGSN